MIRKPIAALAALCTLFCLVSPAAAAQVDSGSVYCFGSSDFSAEENLSGICITGLPESGAGTLYLGSRVLRPGDVLTADQVAQMTFSPLRSEADRTAELEYLAIYPNRVEEPAVMTLSIRGREDKAPVAEDSALETYKNLEAQGRLKVTDPENQPMTYSVVRQPRRGTVEIREDGSFTYTPKKNKVGVDSFVFTATDPAGKVSREATVTVTVLKPTDAPQYTDTIGESCRFAAEWMKHTGIFTAEQVAGNPCFSPDKAVTRGEFLTMLVKTLDLPTDGTLQHTGFEEDVPVWLQPYLAAALRSGLTAGISVRETFGENEPITGEEAAVMLQNVLDLAVESAAEEESAASTSLTVLQRNGFPLTEGNVTRAQAAEALYQTAQMRSTGLGIFTE